MSRAEDIYTELSDSPISRASSLRDYAIQLEETVEQLQADNARLCYALEGYYYSGKEYASVVEDILASTDSSNWLAEHDAKVRREVLEEIDSRYYAAEGKLSLAIIITAMQDELRRMAEQPESK